MENGTTKIFRDHVHTIESYTGLTLSPLIKIYVAELLADFVDKPGRIPPEMALVEMLYEAQTKSQKKQVGDLCLWITGVFPNYKQRYGIRRTYYQQLGASAYRHTQSEVLWEIAEYFPVVSDFVKAATYDAHKIPHIVQKEEI